MVDNVNNLVTSLIIISSAGFALHHGTYNCEVANNVGSPTSQITMTTAVDVQG